MNTRLLIMASHVDAGIGVIDVGTDHGYLPVHLAENGYNGNIFASDINSDPLDKAVRAAEAAGVSDRISFMLCDGLAECPPESIDTIVIAGMGGDMIVKILDEAEWCLCEQYKLILQPMSKAEIVRYWLVNNGFEILAEELAKDNDSIYQIIVARFGGFTRLNDAELFSGKSSLSKNQVLFLEQLDILSDRFKKAVNSMEKGDRAPEYRKLLFESIHTQLEEMRK